MAEPVPGGIGDYQGLLLRVKGVQENVPPHRLLFELELLDHMFGDNVVCVLLEQFPELHLPPPPGPAHIG